VERGRRADDGGYARGDDLLLPAIRDRRHRAGVAAFGARVARFQPILATASLALLVHAFYRAYRPDPTCATPACALPSSVRRRMILWIITVAVLAMLTTSWWASWLIYLTL
jgi:hypothetical protein